MVMPPLNNRRCAFLPRTLRSLAPVLFGIATFAVPVPAHGQQVLYVSNVSANTISRITSAGIVSTFTTGVSEPEGLAFDTSGNLFAASSTSGATANSISKITPGGVVSPFATGLNNPIGIAFDSTGNLYEADQGTNSIFRFTPTYDPVTNPGGKTSYASSVVAGLEGIAFDSSGNLYAANFGANSISKITTGGVVSTFATGSGLDNPTGVAFDAAGNLYASNFSGNTVSKITFTSPGVLGTISTFASGFNTPIGLAFDASGDLYVASANSISKVTPGGVVSPFASGVSRPTYLAFAPSSTSTTPEPGAMALLACLGFSGSLFASRRRRNRASTSSR